MTGLALATAAASLLRVLDGAGWKAPEEEERWQADLDAATEAVRTALVQDVAHAKRRATMTDEHRIRVIYCLAYLQGALCDEKDRREIQAAIASDSLVLGAAESLLEMLAEILSSTK